MNRAASFALASLLVASCQEPAPPSAASSNGPDVIARVAPPSTQAEALTEAVAYGPEVRSLRLRRSIIVRLGPDEKAKTIGTVLAGTRVGWKRAAAGPGCDRWIEIEPRGFICDRYLEPTTKEPRGVVLPELEDGALVPGEYGKIVGTGVTIRKVGEVQVGSRTYWKTKDGKRIDARRIKPDIPSSFAGVWLTEDHGTPVAWARKQPKGAGVVVRAAANTWALAVDTLPPRAYARVAELSADDVWARIGDARWVRVADLAMARTREPPADVRGDEERWLDVDLDEQVVVAYEGRRPVYATLVSTGSKKWPTAAGIYRIWLKMAETDMNGQMAGERAYSVATVPWTMFFAKDLAFHTAYWHDKFGEARSHGCVNLSPRDARTLYEWATPDVPAGWTMTHGILERPGSLVRIHGTETPAIEYRGYAKVVHEKTAG